MIPPFLLQAPPPIGPDDCIITGFCAVRPDQVGPGSGLMFVAIGLVALGAWSWWSARRRGPRGAEIGGRSGGDGSR